MHKLVRIYNENEYTREGANGRIYCGKVGWKWYIMDCGNVIGSHDGYATKTEALIASNRIYSMPQES